MRNPNDTDPTAPTRRLLGLINGSRYNGLFELPHGSSNTEELVLPNGVQLERLASFDHDYLGWHYLALDFGKPAPGDVRCQTRVVLFFVDWQQQEVVLLKRWPWESPWRKHYVEAAMYVEEYRRTGDPIVNAPGM